MACIAWLAALLDSGVLKKQEEYLRRLQNMKHDDKDLIEKLHADAVSLKAALKAERQVNRQRP